MKVPWAAMKSRAMYLFLFCFASLPRLFEVHLGDKNRVCRRCTPWRIDICILMRWLPVRWVNTFVTLHSYQLLVSVVQTLKVDFLGEFWVHEKVLSTRDTTLHLRAPERPRCLGGSLWSGLAELVLRSLFLCSVESLLSLLRSPPLLFLSSSGAVFEPLPQWELRPYTFGYLAAWRLLSQPGGLPCS